MNNHRINTMSLAVLTTLGNYTTMESGDDFEECFEALIKASEMVGILRTDPRNRIKESTGQWEEKLAAVVEVEKDPDPVPPAEKPAEDKPTAKPKSRKPKASEDTAAEGQDTSDAPPPADAPAKPKINEVLWWDGENQEHRKVLIMILKEHHNWDSKTPENLALASMVKTELQKCEIDHTRQDLIRAKVREIMEDLQTVIAKKNSEVKAPF